MTAKVRLSGDCSTTANLFGLINMSQKPDKSVFPNTIDVQVSMGVAVKL